MNYDALLELLSKKLLAEQELDVIEQERLEEWMKDPVLRDFVDNDLNLRQVLEAVRHLQEMDRKRLGEKMAALRAQNPRGFVKPLIRYMVAASILMALGITSYLIFFHTRKLPEGQVIANVQPAVNKAKLRLSNGTVLLLDSTKDGQIAKEGIMAVEKSGGKLEYVSTGGANNQNNQIAGDNVLSVPRGALFEVTLDDNTHVWLNSASELTYPVKFGKERRVKLIGEGFFQVAKDAQRPFVLETPKGAVQILGTSFDANAYPEDSAELITLIEGAIQVNVDKQALFLKPGDQAFERDGNLSLKHPNPQNVTAWRRGFFSFQEADIQAIMRQLCRFYDVQVKYVGEVSFSTQTYDGTISRNQTLEETLTALQQLNIKATLSDRTIIVDPEKPHK